MAENEDGSTLGRGGAPDPSQENRDRDQTGIAGDAAVEGDGPSPGDGERGEAPPADDRSAIDLDSVHDRAS